MKLTQLLFTLFVCVSASVSSAAQQKSHGGLSLGETRIIINEGTPNANINAVNESNTAYIIQNKIVKHIKRNETSPSFFVSPPLLELKPTRSARLRVTTVNATVLPKDRESVVFLAIKAVPNVDKAKMGANQMLVMFTSYIKVFYRPQNLPFTSDEIFKHLKFTLKGQKMTIENNTPYNLSPAGLTVGQVKFDINNMVKPYSRYTWTLPQKPTNHHNKVHFALIDDIGGMRSQNFAF